MNYIYVFLCDAFFCISVYIYSILRRCYLWITKFQFLCVVRGGNELLLLWRCYDKLLGCKPVWLFIISAEFVGSVYSKLFVDIPLFLLLCVIFGSYRYDNCVLCCVLWKCAAKGFWPHNKSALIITGHSCTELRNASCRNI